MTRRLAGGAVVAAVALAAGCGGTENPEPPTATASSGSTLPLVACEESIGGARYSGTDDGARVLLGAISVPPEYRPEAAAPSDGKPWKYGVDLDIVVRAEKPPVELAVPKEWRKRLALSLGATKLVPAVRISSCPNNGLPWNAFTLSVSLDERTACVPLMIRSGSRSATVQFGIGQRCAPS